MLRLLDAPVTADEIDHLGHLNVRRYARRAWDAAQAWFARHGLDEATLAARGLVLTPADQLVHFYQEQHLGAPLGVDAAVTEVGGQPCLYLEILNTESGARAAAFLVAPGLADRATRTPVAAKLPWAEGPRIPLPAHAAPRSLSFAPPRLDVALAELERRCPNWPRLEGAVPAEACDEAGFLILTGGQDVDFVAIDANSHRGHLLAGEGHATFGWAVLESRQLLTAYPRAGDRVRVISAELRIERKTHWTRRWAFDPDRDRLFAVLDTVSLAFDPAARRSIEIPPGVRRGLEAQRLPDFA